MHHNYCIIKKFIYQIGNLDKNRQEKKRDGPVKKKTVSKTAQDRGQKKMNHEYRKIASINARY